MFGRTTIYTLVMAVVTTLLFTVYAVTQYVPPGSVENALLIRAPKLTTDVWVVFNPDTGNVEYGNHVDDARPIASITKLFTAYTVLSTHSEGVTTTVSWADLATDGGAGKLTYGETLSLHDLLFPLLIESSNDAGSAISRTLGIRYKAALDEVLESLMLKNTTIVDATGLGVGNVSSPHDLALFYAHLRSLYPHIIDITKLRMYITLERGLINNNPLRTLGSYGGGKYGFTPEAGRTFVGTITLPQNGKEIGIVILGSKDLLADTTALIASFK